MALECAHCNARVPDGAQRCPQCLRSTGLIAAPDEPAPARSTARNVRTALVAVLALVVSAGVAALVLRSLRAGTSMRAIEPPPGVAAADVPPALEAGPDLAPVVARVRAAGDALARARAAADAVSTLAQAHGTRRVTDPDETPPARSPDAIYRALSAPDARVTSLDLARLEAAVVLAAGTPARVGERTAGARVDEPADPSGVLGSYVVLLDGGAIDPNTQTVLPTSEVRAQPVEGRALLGAMLAQTALSVLAHEAAPTRDRLLALADGAVSAWPDGPVALAVRARAWETVGASGGASLADQDLASAAALRNDAAFHLLRARLALRRGDVRLAATESMEARMRAPAFGDAALAYAVFASLPGALPDAGDTCGALAISRETWTNDALALCRRDGDENTRRDAAQRLMASGHDPLRLAYAAAAGAEGAASRTLARDRTELAAWLSVQGREDLASQVLGRADAGR